MTPFLPSDTNLPPKPRAPSPGPRSRAAARPGAEPNATQPQAEAAQPQAGAAQPRVARPGSGRLTVD
jgi:hypothetical protein